MNKYKVGDKVKLECEVEIVETLYDPWDDPSIYVIKKVNSDGTFDRCDMTIWSHELAELAAEESEPVTPKFNWELFNTGKQAVNCRTEHDAEVFLAWLAGKGISWLSDESLLTETNWGVYKEHTTYVLGCLGSEGLSYQTGEFYKMCDISVILFTRKMLAEVE